MQHQWVEKQSATLLHQYLGAIKKGSKKASANEITSASDAIGLLALKAGRGDNAREIYEESVGPLDESLTSSGSDASKISSLVRCLAIITFVGGTDDKDQTQKSMDIMWRLINPKLGSNVVSVKPSPSLITSVVSAWSFLLSTMANLKLNSESSQNSITYLFSLLHKEDRSVRIVAGEALALIFEKSWAGPNSESDTSEEESYYVGIHDGLKEKVIHQVKNLAVEAVGKGCAKKDLNTQRDLFRDIAYFFEYGYCPKIKTKIGGDTVKTSSWSQLIQLNFFRHFLGGGFIKQMQENELLHQVFDFKPKRCRRNLVDDEHRIMSVVEKRMFRSLNKARTRLLNKQRLLSEDRNFGHYAVNAVDF